MQQGRTSAACSDSRQAVVGIASGRKLAAGTSVEDGRVYSISQTVSQRNGPKGDRVTPVEAALLPSIVGAEHAEEMPFCHFPFLGLGFVGLVVQSREDDRRRCARIL